MIFGIGTDLVSQPRIVAAVQRYGDRFLRRILTERELTDLAARPRNDAQFIRFVAQRFAAKEAFSKALGTGMRQGVGWRDAGVHNEAGGRPLLHVSTAMRARLASLDIEGMHVSLSDEVELTVAVVMLEKRT
jgi:holo-[acyl-carrier protein] synthase